jgi:bifunctional non-homologous end joining protein LigD
MSEPDEPLAEYRRKRDFTATPEPEGEGGHPAPVEGEVRRFTIHQHDATRLHWDLRMENGAGELWSFAVPRGIPWDPGRNGLAVHTEDHPLEYLTFEGDIPEGTYGAGHMFVWDTGTFELLEEKDGKLVVDLRGRRVQGRYALFRTRGERDWMIHRMDPPPDPDHRWPPEVVAPMRATAGEAVGGDGWAWEVRQSGLRVMTTLLPGAVRMHDDKGRDVSDRFVDVRRIGRATGSVEAVVDGVVVGEPAALRRRFEGRPMSADRAMQSAPVKLLLFDLVWLDGYPRWDDPWEERRGLLDDLALDGPAWSTLTAHRGDGLALVEAAGEHGVSGLVGKRRDSPYRCGEASPDWIGVDLA